MPSQRESKTSEIAASSRSPMLGRWIGMVNNEMPVWRRRCVTIATRPACSRRGASDDVKLVMTLRTRDQADIVDALVAFHLTRPSTT